MQDVTLFKGLKRRIERFRKEKHGERFVARYRRRQQQQPSLARTVMAVGLGLVLIAAGLAMLVLPGPGLLVGVIGAALIAGESLTASRLLDRFDLWLTGLWRRWRG